MRIRLRCSNKPSILNKFNYLNMKARLLFIIGSLISVTGLSHAQEYSIRKDTVVQESVDRYKVVTNHFFNNWFIGLGAGAQMMFGDHNRQMYFGDQLSPFYQGYLGKWFTPGLGLRVGINGFKINGLTQNGAHSTGERYDKIPWEGYWLTKQEINYYSVYGDVFFNLTNMFSGYRQDRIYHFSPYVGLGWSQVTNEPKEREVSVNAGLFNTFQLAKPLRLTLDIRGKLVNDRLDGELGGRREEGILSAALGLQYSFGKVGWEKPREVVISYSDSDIKLLRDALSQLQADKALLEKQLAEANSDQVTEVVVEKERSVLAAPLLVTFPISKSDVSNEARVNLGFFAKVIKEGDADVVYQLTGYADKGTGSKRTNERLSKARAEAIYDVLVNEFGVPAAQLEVAHEGGVDNMFYDDPRLSRAVITVAK